MRFNELIAGVKQDVAIKIFGEDLNTLTDLSKQVGKVVSSVDGAKDLYVEEVTGLPQIVVNINRDEVAKYGLNVEDINNALSTAFAGQSAGIVYEGEKDLTLYCDCRMKTGSKLKMYATSSLLHRTATKLHCRSWQI